MSRPPSCYVDRAVLAEGDDVGQPLVPALLVHERLVELVLAGVSVDPRVPGWDPDLRDKKKKKSMKPFFLHVHQARSQALRFGRKRNPQDTLARAACTPVSDGQRANLAFVFRTGHARPSAYVVCCDRKVRVFNREAWKIATQPGGNNVEVEQEKNHGLQDRMDYKKVMRGDRGGGGVVVS